MKLRTIFAAAGLAIAAMGVSGTADARPHDDRGAWHDNGRHRGWDNDRGYRDGRHYRGARRCWTEWRHHHRVRVCR